MRIALLSWQSLHAVTVGSVAVHVFELAAALARAGHEVHLFTRLGRHQSLTDTIRGVRLHRCPADPKHDFPDEIAALGESLQHYTRAAVGHEGPFDWIHCHDWLTVGAGLGLVETHPSAGEHLAVTFHTTEWGRAGTWPESEEALRIAALERRAVRDADALFVVTHEVRRQLDALYQCPDWKTALVHHGIDPHPFDTQPFDAGSVKRKYGIDPMAPTVLFVGRLRHRKGPDLLLQAVPALREAWPAARVLFVGEGEMRGHLEKETERFGLSETVRFLGWLPGPEQIELYRACDVVTVPSRAEPYGMSALSAWAARKPIVATNVGGPQEITWNEVNGLLVEPSPEGVAEGILALFADFDRARWMGQQGRIAVETAFSWDVLARSTLETYERAMRLARL